MGIIEVGVKEWQLDERHVTSTARPKYLLLDLNHSTGGRVFNASWQNKFEITFWHLLNKHLIYQLSDFIFDKTLYKRFVLAEASTFYWQACLSVVSLHHRLCWPESLHSFRPTCVYGLRLGASTMMWRGECREVWALISPEHPLLEA